MFSDHGRVSGPRRARAEGAARSLRPLAVSVVPEDTARLARAACRTNSRTSPSATSRGPASRSAPAPTCSRAAANRPSPPRSWPSSPAGNAPQGCRRPRPPTRCARGSTGVTSPAWNWTTPAPTPRSSARPARGGWPARGKRCSSKPSFPDVGSAAGARRGRQRTDSTHVRAAIRARNRLEAVGALLRHALNSPAVAAPDWRAAHAAPAGAARYGRRVALALAIGADGQARLRAVYAAAAPTWPREVPAVGTRRRARGRRYRRDAAGIRRRVSGDLPPAAVFSGSPPDDAAHYARKRATPWVGHKVRIAEACDDDSPHPIISVATAAGPTADGAATPAIHAALKPRDLLPRVHIADTGSLDAELLVSSRDGYRVALLGPVRGGHRWRARAGEGFPAQQCPSDGDKRRATCPAGRTSSSRTPAVDDRPNDVITSRPRAPIAATAPTSCGAAGRQRSTRVGRLPSVRRQGLRHRSPPGRARRRRPAPGPPPCARGPHLRPAPHAVYRPGADTPRPCLHRHGAQFLAPRWGAHRATARPVRSRTTRSAAGQCGGRLRVGEFAKPVFSVANPPCLLRVATGIKHRHRVSRRRPLPPDARCRSAAPAG